jgi:hypothetical protein
MSGPNKADDSSIPEHTADKSRAYENAGGASMPLPSLTMVEPATIIVKET